MKDCFIVGSGRSGTSMVAGLLGSSGYFMGNKLDAYEGEANPKGFFEDPDINAVNEMILQPVIPRRPREPIGRIFFSKRNVPWSLWLSRVPPEVDIPAPAAHVASTIRSLTATRPFCFKDPRFSYTLPIWLGYAPDARVICVFREPNRTAQSMLKEARRAEYLRHFNFDYGAAIGVWEAMYRRILDQHLLTGSWLFVHYDQALSGEAAERIEEFTGARVDRSFPETTLARSPAEGVVPPHVGELYERLCGLARS